MHSLDTLPQMHRNPLSISIFLLKKVDIHEQSPYLKRASGNPLYKVLTKMSKSSRDIEFKQYFVLLKDDDNFKIKFPDKVGLLFTSFFQFIWLRIAPQYPLPVIKSY